MKAINKTIEFWTPGKIDPLSWSVMGINSKPDSDNPIGFFGTGLKMAIAVLLRTGHTVHITAEGEEYNFTTQVREFRGKEFNFCFCNEDKLPFTTELGKNWEVWMAYRELVSNTMDEKGEFGPEQGMLEGSTITVTGPDIYKCWQNHNNYFCVTEPLETTKSWEGNIEIHKGSGIIFYKGVKIAEAEDSAYNYNILHNIKLTEDRTAHSFSDITVTIAKAVSNIKNPSIIRKIFTNKKGFEKNLHFDYINLDETVMSELSKIWSEDPHSILDSALSKFRKQNPLSEFVEIEFDTSQLRMLYRAKDFLKKAGYPINAEIKLIENKNQNVIAFVHKDVIHLTPRAFNKGMFDLVQTLMEEHFHTLGYMDESRSFEHFLMDELITQTNKHIQYDM